jgi:hypothetical protein
MPVTAMAMDVVCEDSGHNIVPNCPNVCLTPAAPAPLPMPYPLTGNSMQLDPGTADTKVAGKKASAAFCKVAMVHGNEPGVAATKDITVTGTNMGKAWPLPIPAVTIHFEGKPVTVTGNPGFGNSK